VDTDEKEGDDPVDVGPTELFVVEGGDEDVGVGLVFEAADFCGGESGLC
jgi:hypothetical protein